MTPDPDQRHVVRMQVNGRDEVLHTTARVTLADALRHDLGLVGTRVGCEQGVCGACTVLLDGEPVRGCLTLAVQADGASVGTVEGLSDTEELGDLQRRFWEHQALQCGFCTAGFLITATKALEEDPGLDREGIRERISGNLCRCTGYQTIVDAIEDHFGSRRVREDAP